MRADNPYLAHRKGKNTVGQKSTGVSRKRLMPLLVGRQHEPSSSKTLATSDQSQVRIQAGQKDRYTEKIKPASAFGNYPHYYGYRLADTRIDPRLGIFDKSWFEGKSVLDIGCNSGLLTIQCAFFFQPKKIEGIDIDLGLIRKAKSSLHSFASLCSQAQEATPQNCDYFPISCLQIGKRPLFSSTLHSTIDTDSSKKTLFPANIHFRCSDWVNEPVQAALEMTKYDLILALSITKWIHLHGGDGGLKYFFRKVHDSLNPGGRFILEPQDWSGYAKRANLTPQMKDVYNKLKFHPQSFVEYLLSPQVGFVSAESLSPEGDRKGFKRQIYVLRKRV